LDRQRLLLLCIVVVAIFAVAAFVVIVKPFEKKTSPSLTTQSGVVSNSAANSSWTTYHGSNLRNGYDQYEPSIHSPLLAWKYSGLDGNIYAEPLLVNRILYIATEGDSVYAFNETSGFIIWKTNLGTPVAGSSLPCGDIDPSGITGTPVIDVASHTIYVVAFLSPGNHVLFALNTINGAVVFQKTVDPSGANPLNYQQRAALALANGYVYVAYGGLFGDCGDYHGWVIGVPTNGMGSSISYRVPSGIDAGIWAPSGPAIDSSGNIYVVTGNSGSTASFDYGESVIKLSPKLQVLSYFAPSDWVSLNSGDTDLGSIGPILLPGNLIFQLGKDGVGYLLDSNNLGGIGGYIFSQRECGGAYGGAAFANSTIFVPCDDGLVALQLNSGSSPSFTKLWSSRQFFAGPPIVAGGAVWTIDTGNSVLYAFSTQDGSMLFSYNLGTVDHFASPTSGNGYVFVGAGSSVYAFVISSS
jgi:outer membrane protein assembly factor BamB